MRYIRASWKGYEIDSSEFWASISTDEPYKVIKAFYNSKNIVHKQSAEWVCDKFIDASELAMLINKEKFSQIEEDGTNLRNVYSQFKDDSQRNLELGLEAIKATNILVKHFPSLLYHFANSTLSFYRTDPHEEETANLYEVSIVGLRTEYSQSWYDEGDWKAVLYEISQEASIKFSAKI